MNIYMYAYVSNQKQIVLKFQKKNGSKTTFPVEWNSINMAVNSTAYFN